MSIQIEEKPFGKLKDGSDVKLYKLTNQNGMSVEVVILQIKLWNKVFCKNPLLSKIFFTTIFDFSYSIMVQQFVL